MECWEGKWMTNIKTYNTNQIGGCVVTIETNTTKIVIDFGENLSGSDSENVEIEGLTYGTPFFDAVFFTHYHGDHIGRIGSILTDIPLYIGKTAIKVIETIADAINNKELLQILSDHERVHGLAAKTSVKIGDIVVTPYTVDHSAYEAFMFLIETPDKTIFHTGDFREHGYQGAGGLMPVIRKYITGIGKRKVDILITEGTMLSRQTEKHYTEADMKRDALQLFENNRYVFLICSSTNVDSLATFYNAGKWYGMRMYCNWYVEKQLANYTDSAGGKSSLYRFEKVHQWHPEKELISRDGWRGTQFDLLVEHGFVAIIKGDAAYERWIQDFEERSGKKAIVIYSMWEGYVKPGKCQDKELTEFCQRHHAIHMHTSGHAYVDTLEKVINEINPNEAIIPIHTEYPERFKKLNISEELKGKVRGDYGKTKGEE